MIKKSIIENGGGFDSKSDTLGSNPNQLNIRSMYGEIDLEANDFETEFQASFEELIWFVVENIEDNTVVIVRLETKKESEYKNSIITVHNLNIGKSKRDKKLKIIYKKS